MKKTIMALFVVIMGVAVLIACFYELYLPQIQPPAQRRQATKLITMHKLTDRELPINPKVTVTTKIIATICDGDYVLPQFSPNGRFLAYARVLSAKDKQGKNFENTEILLLDTVAQRTKVLLSADKAKNYAVHQSFVIEINWLDNKQLQVIVGDGDIGATFLIFDILSRKVIKTDYREGYASPLPLVGAKRQAFDRAISLFPKFDRGVLESVIRNSGLVLPDRGIVYQKNCQGQDNHIWFLDFDRKSNRCLLKLPAKSDYAIKGGFAFGGGLLLLLEYAAGSVARMYRYQNGLMAVIDEYHQPENPSLTVLHSSAAGVFFMVNLSQTYNKSDNQLYFDDGKKLWLISDCQDLWDADIDRQGQKIAFCYWRDHQRWIKVKELKRLNACGSTFTLR
jgi:hypothetical protein